MSPPGPGSPFLKTQGRRNPAGDPGGRFARRAGEPGAGCRIISPPSSGWAPVSGRGGSVRDGAKRRNGRAAQRCKKGEILLTFRATYPTLKPSFKITAL